MQYDLSTSTFSPDGKIFQTEYAAKAVSIIGTVIGLRCRDGIVLGIEKPIVSKMLEKGSNRRAYAVDMHAGLAVAGVAADGRQIINRASYEASNYKSTYGEPIPGHVLNERIASYVHIFSMHWSTRPYGSAALLAIWDAVDGPQLYLTEPSGNSMRYFGTAVGKNKQAAKTEIERLNLEDLGCEQGVREVAKIMHSIRDDEKPFELEMAWICEASGRKFQQIPQDVIADAEKKAKEAIEAADMED